MRMVIFSVILSVCLKTIHLRIVTLSVPYSSINGWEIGFSPCYRGSNYDFFTASKDKKAKGIICFNLREANAKTYEDIEEIEFTLGIYYDELSIITDEPVLNKRIKLEFKNGVIMYSE